ncbi:hypothetical protein VTN02DRAFT_3498 [Thermoascus thermophilus]
MACSRGIEQLHCDGEGVVFGQQLALHLAGPKHELARFLHSAETNSLLLQQLLRLDRVQRASNQQLDKRLVGLLVGHHPATEHVRVDIESLGNRMVRVHMQLDRSGKQGVVRSDRGDETVSKQILESGGDLGVLLVGGQLHDPVRRCLGLLCDGIGDLGRLRSGRFVGGCSLSSLFQLRGLLQLGLLLLDLDLPRNRLLHLGTHIDVHRGLLRVVQITAGGAVRERGLVAILALLLDIFRRRFPAEFPGELEISPVVVIPGLLGMLPCRVVGR